MNYKIIIYLICCFSIASGSIYTQEFYINTVDNTQLENDVYLVNVSNSSQELQALCPPTNNTQQYFENTYTDIAIDYQNNTYYVSALGSLYRKNFLDSSCEFLGKFAESVGTINALVADSNNFIYAAGNLNSVGTLFRYDIILDEFSQLGNLPDHYIPAGDLFFYNDRLFLTSIDTTTLESCIIEINMVEPELSCYYMTLNDFVAYGAFSVNFGSYSKSYILTDWNNNNEYSSLIEIDIENREILNTIRNYNHRVYGAAAYYNQTSTNSICVNFDVNDFNGSDLYFNLINPTSNNLVFTTNIELSSIKTIGVFDIQGKKVTTFNTINHNNLDVTHINTGFYIVEVLTDSGKIITKKLIID